MICLAGRNNVLQWEPLLKVWLKRGVECPLPFVDNDKHRSKLTFMFSIWFQKPIKPGSSRTCLYPCFPLRRAYLLLYVESVYLLLSVPEANPCVNCVQQFLYAYLLHLLYFFVLTTIYMIYMFKVESQCWNLYLPLCCFNALLLR